MSLIIRYFRILEDSYLDVIVLDGSLQVMGREPALLQVCSHSGMSCGKVREKVSPVAAVMYYRVEIYLKGFRMVKNGRILEI